LSYKVVETKYNKLKMEISTHTDILQIFDRLQNA